MDWNQLRRSRPLRGGAGTDGCASPFSNPDDDELLGVLHASFPDPAAVSRTRRPDPRPAERQEWIVPGGLRLLQPVGAVSHRGGSLPGTLGQSRL